MKLSRHSFQALGLCTLALSVACAAAETGHSLAVGGAHVAADGARSTPPSLPASPNELPAAGADALPGPSASEGSPVLAQSSVHAGAVPAAQAVPMLGEMLTGQVMLLSLLLTPLAQAPAQLPASPSQTN
jgi:hypothetical protein